MAYRMDGRQCAHVWNAQSQESGSNHNGQFYFEGRTIYSYGQHFPVAWISPDGTALFNDSRYSITTSKHQSYARSAATNRPSVGLPEFGNLIGTLGLIAEVADTARFKGGEREARKCIRDHMRRYIRDNAAELGRRDVRGAWDYETHEYKRLESAGKYLTRLAGLPAASWPKLQREAERDAKREAEREAKMNLRSRIASAQIAADRPDSDYTRVIRETLESAIDPAETFRREALRLEKMVKQAAELKLGKRRIAALKSRAKQMRALMPIAEERGRLAKKRQLLRESIGYIKRTLPEWFNSRCRDMAAAGNSRIAWEDSERLRSGACHAERLSGFAGFPFATRRRLQTLRERLESVAYRIEAERVRIAEAELAERKRIERLEQAERIAEWYKGNPHVRVRFDSEHGGAALRVRGDKLETSWGADVPLSHAVRVFRFLKLCRDSGQAWQRNGRTIRVGHFQVDSVDTAGNFIAGCHEFSWQEVERVAREAGVFDCPASDAALEVKESISA